ncbi:carboxymuconolactone decarboxylase family protein [Erythrobacter sp. Alg231-14]|uniref:carboxymuconolactone decarboxylase family protein n=1 Tax=Erythrobacter sp. Alg231-14 TaxID=1922225 RepID=UPI000D55D5F8
MARIAPLTIETAESKAAELLGNVKASLGMVPNIFGTMANSSALLEGYLGLSGALGSASLSAQLNEQIALTVAGANTCDYCASAHTTLGKMAGVSDEEMARNLGGLSEDPRTQHALNFAREIVAERGRVNGATLDNLREAGFADQQILEIFGQVMANIFTNYFNHLADTEIDFPVVNAPTATAA